MLLHEEKKAGVDFWQLSGSLTIRDVAEASVAFLTVQARSKRRLLDMAGLTECDVAGLQLLMAMIADAERKSIKLDIPAWPLCIKECARTTGFSLPPTI